jgi:DNA end-binding protein Ku
VLALNTLRWAAEVRSYDELKLPAVQKKSGVSARELQMAKKLIEDMSDTWDPAAYHDTFHDDIMTLVERKVREGKTEEIDEVEAPRETRRSADILDLSELLKRSLGGGKGRSGASRKRGRAGDDADATEADNAVKDGKRGAKTERARTTDAASAAPRRAKSRAPAKRATSGTASRKRRAA